jgi:hypothetical protein
MVVELGLVICGTPDPNPTRQKSQLLLPILNLSDFFGSSAVPNSPDLYFLGGMRPNKLFSVDPYYLFVSMQLLTACGEFFSVPSVAEQLTTNVHCVHTERTFGDSFFLFDIVIDRIPLNYHCS